jgi:hypothetical protein
VNYPATITIAPTSAPTIRLGDIANRYRENGKNPARRRIRVLLNVAGKQIMRGHALSVGIDHLTVSVPSPLSLDQECAVFFGLTIGGQIFSIIGAGRVTQCTGAETDGYCAAMNFSVSDKKSRIAIEQLFSKSNSNCVQ